MNTTTTELNAGWQTTSCPPTRNGYYQVRFGAHIERARYVVSAGEWLSHTCPGGCKLVYPTHWRVIPSAACDNDGWHYASNAPTKDGWYQVRFGPPRVEQALYVVSVGDWFLNNRVVYPKVWREIPAAACSSYDDGWLPVDHPTLPPTRHPVLCLTDDGPIVGYRDCELWFATLGDKAVRVKAWRELPAYDRSDDCCDNGFEEWWSRQAKHDVSDTLRWTESETLVDYTGAKVVWSAALASQRQ